jgi:hypothetical protein
MILLFLRKAYISSKLTNNKTKREATRYLFIGKFSNQLLYITNKKKQKNQTMFKVI